MNQGFPQVEHKTESENTHAHTKREIIKNWVRSRKSLPVQLTPSPV